MMLPILISVSEAPGSYFFSAAAELAPAEMPSSNDASRMMHLCAISTSPWVLPAFFTDLLADLLARVSGSL
jgi:hypothetical protein